MKKDISGSELTLNWRDWIAANGTTDFSQYDRDPSSWTPGTPSQRESSGGTKLSFLLIVGLLLLL
jgi:hypothetical protein